MYFVRFLVQMKTAKSLFEIIWPLEPKNVRTVCHIFLAFSEYINFIYCNNGASSLQDLCSMTLAESCLVHGSFFFLAKLLRRRKRLSFLASRPSKASSLSSSELELSNAFARCGKKWIRFREFLRMFFFN